uniref:Uncharacterized protein n=1 Tax=Suricata suricatta TaxID=37032 RepID=A0A673SVC3_SURSU
MSYCWRLQYYCKLGAAHRAGPIYYVSQLPVQAPRFRNQLRVPALPGGARGMGATDPQSRPSPPCSVNAKDPTGQAVSHRLSRGPGESHLAQWSGAQASGD